MVISGLVMIFILSIASTGLIRKYAMSRAMMDVPNERSSHSIPTPKGGGISIVIILLGTVAASFYCKGIDLDLSMSLLIGLIIVATTGLFDDYNNLPISVRAVLYVLASIISIYLIGGFSSLTINTYRFNLGSFGFVLSVLFVVWITNLYNFMDGTDGFAAIQTICVSLFCGSLLYLSGNFSVAIILFCLVASSLGFLYWNWAPAKIFMGDVGSCTIGFLFGLLSLYTGKEGVISMSVWLILLAPFIGDATFTLFRRIMNKEKWCKAHNSHVYQKLYQLGMSHGKLAKVLLGVNIILVWPFAYLAYLYKNIEFTMLILTYFIMGIIWLAVQNKFKKIKSTFL